MPHRQLTLPLMLGVAPVTAGCGNDTSAECSSALQINVHEVNTEINVGTGASGGNPECLVSLTVN